ncbi:unnamed protein product [Cyprideis torosa]|uniref:Uncharacterized protein n=1 Tax=Cyprideis torosa TaxID=163714 RepID=A0A7R8WCE2_9CRUS|nr:unnamed protein product [Cyprideis torosa]CAG0887308.1 unnamed protein product [Cyprideis torosa]
MWNWTTMSFSGGGARYSQMRPTPWPAPPGAMNVLLLGGRGAYENVAVMPEHDSFVDGQNEPGFTDEIPLDEEPHDDKDDQIPFFRSRRSMTSFTRTNSATSSRTSFGETDMVELFYDQDQHILVPPGEDWRVRLWSALSLHQIAFCTPVRFPLLFPGVHHQGS